MPVLKSDYYKQFGSLKSCPCCGAPAEWRGGSSTPDYIKCSKCNLKYTGGSNLQKLTDGWNARAEKTCYFIPEVTWSYEDENGEVIDTELMSPFEDCGAASCSACGMSMMTGDGGWFNEEEQPNGGIKLIPKFKYCPYCGAKVVQDE